MHDDDEFWSLLASPHAGDPPDDDPRRLPPEFRVAAVRAKMSPAIVPGGHVFFTGVTGSDDEGRMPADPEAQFRAAFGKIGRALGAAGRGGSRDSRSCDARSRQLSIARIRTLIPDTSKVRTFLNYLVEQYSGIPPWEQRLIRNRESMGPRIYGADPEVQRISDASKPKVAGSR